MILVYNIVSICSCIVRYHVIDIIIMYSSLKFFCCISCLLVCLLMGVHYHNIHYDIQYQSEVLHLVILSWVKISC
jgi:hypothetical protein